MTFPPHDLGGYRLASLVQLYRNGPCWTLLVDGQRFPFLIDRVVDTQLDTDDVPSVTVTLIADRVQVDNHARDYTGRRAHPAAWQTGAGGAEEAPDGRHGQGGETV